MEDVREVVVGYTPDRVVLTLKLEGRIVQVGLKPKTAEELAELLRESAEAAQR